MHYEVEVDGRLRQVVVHRHDGQFVVSVDGRESAVDAVRVDAHTWSLLIGGASFEVTLAPDGAAGQLAVTVGHVPSIVALNGRRRWSRKDDGATRGVGSDRLVAPMPGKIVRVLVKPGDTVAARQPLVVIEAMKMENELRASHDGVVKELTAREGQSVDAGTLLAIIGPA